MYLTQSISRVAALMSSASLATSTTITTLGTSTCSRTPIAACPTPYDPCCAFVCAEAQVPFDLCSPNNRTFFASCYACYPPTSIGTLTTPPSSMAPTATGTPGYTESMLRVVV